MDLPARSHPAPAIGKAPVLRKSTRVSSAVDARPTSTIVGRTRRPTRESQPRSAETRTRILAAAYQLVRDKGYAHLSIAKVASAAGIAKGNLQYHYPAKRQLLEAMVEHYVDLDISAATASICDPDLTPIERFDRYLDYVVHRKRGTKAPQVIFEVYAYAAHNRSVGRLIATWHQWALSRCVEILGDLQPRLDTKERQRIGESVHLMLTASLFCMANSSPTEVEKIIDSIVTTARQLALGTKAPAA